MRDPPIAVFCYNRPKHLEAVLKSIARSENFYKKKLPLFIFCDAPKKPEHIENVEKTIAVAKNFCRGNVIIREKNMGFRNITEGISTLCDQYGKAIVIEDDIIIAPDFLPYMCAALDRYENCPQVFGITGFMFFDTHPPKPALFFQPHAFIWGWATWKRAWDHYKWEPKGWETYLKNRRKRYHFNCLGSIKYSKMVEKTLTGIWNTWDAQWLYTVFKEKGLFLSPYRSLTWNCGCGGGFHGDASKDKDLSLSNREYYIHGNLELEDFEKPRVADLFSEDLFPKKIECSKKAVRRLAINFIKEDLRKYPKVKKFRKLLKLFYHRIALFFMTEDF